VFALALLAVSAALVLRWVLLGGVVAICAWWADSTGNAKEAVRELG